jgi:putative ABC transport system ATP-binding protein
MTEPMTTSTSSTTSTIDGAAALAASRAAATGPMVVTEDLRREFKSGDGVIAALGGVSVEIPRGQLVAVRGRSGSGKTTFLSLIGGLDRPTSGRVVVDGLELSSLSDRDLVEVRRRTIAFVFQSFGLLPILTAAENVEVPMRLVKAEPKARDHRVAELLDMVGLGERMRHRPHELSGGEQQRVAIARALANRPSLLLADEPTGQLDLETGHRIMTVLRNVARQEHITAMVATHDQAMIDVADRVIELRDGQIVADTGLLSRAI